VTAAHIHQGAPGTADDILASLLATADPLDVPNGIVAQGSLEASVLVGPLENQPLERLVYQMLTGNTYVNIHTVLNPMGAIRGQIGPGDVSETSCQSLVYDLATAQAYVNVHTGANPNGEIRGQVYPVAGPTLVVELTGAQETPSVTTPAAGWALFFTNPGGDSM